MSYFKKKLHTDFLLYELWKRIKRSPWLYLGGVFLVLLTNIQEILTPKFIQWTIDLLSTRDINLVPGVFRASSASLTMYNLGYCFILVSVFAWIGRWGWRHTLARATHIAAKELRKEFWEKTSPMPISLLERYPVGDLMNRVTSDWNAARFIFGFTLVLTLDVVFVTIIAFASMFLMDAPFAFLCLCLFPIVFRPIYRCTLKQRHTYEKSQQQLSVLCDYISQSLHTIRLQKATNTESMWIKNLEREATKYADLRYAAMKEGWKLFPLATLPSILCFGVLFSFGFYRWQMGFISVGEFIALHSYILVLQIPLYELGDCIAEWQKGFAGLSRIIHVQDTVDNANQYFPSANLPAACKDFKSIELKHSQIEVDSQFLDFQSSIRIVAGQKILLQGPVGSGKSLLFSKLTGIREAEENHIFVNGRDICSYSSEQLGKYFALQEQKVFIFRGTVRSNLCLGQIFSEEEIWLALYRVCLDDEIRRLEFGLDTVLQENGVNLSGGQKQRLSLARIFLRPSPVWLLDDPLSAVDMETELKILNRIKDLMQERTIVFCTSREPPPIYWDQKIRFKSPCVKTANSSHGNISINNVTQQKTLLEITTNA